MAPIDRAVGSPTKRNTSSFTAQWTSIDNRIGWMPEQWTGLEGRVLRGGSSGESGDTQGPVNFYQDVVGGGRIDQRNAAVGDVVFFPSETGICYCSTNSTDFTWTLHPSAPVGNFIPWIQMGNGKIIFGVGSGGTFINLDNNTKSGGLYSEGMCRVIGLNVNGKSIWKLTGETS